MENGSITLLLFTRSYSIESFFQTLLLRQPDWTLILRGSEEEVLATLQEASIDLVVVEEELENLCCRDFCEKMRNIRDYRAIPLLIITRSLKRSHMRGLVRAGATAFLREPLEEEEVKGQLKDALKKEQIEGKMKILSALVSATPTSSSLVCLDGEEAQLFEKMERAGYSLALLVIGMDHYEEIKKKSGKEGIKEIESLLEQILQRLLVYPALFFSYQEELSLLILPDVSTKEASLFAHNLLRRAKEGSFSREDTSFTITLSIGIAHLEGNRGNKGFISFHDLLTRAMEMREEAKKRGNEVALYSES